MDPSQSSINPSQSLNPCNEKSPLQNQLNYDKTPDVCHESDKTLKGTDSVLEHWLDDNPTKKTGWGDHGNCDPMMQGKIVNNELNPNTLYKYSGAFRGCNEAILKLLTDPPIVITDENHKIHTVPVMHQPMEKAVAAVFQDNFRKDSLVVDRIRLPIIAFHCTDIQFNQQRYTHHNLKLTLSTLRDDGKPGFTNQEKLKRDTVFGVARGLPVDISYAVYVWTLYLEDMHQIVEQIILKLAPQVYINVSGVHWEVPVRIDSIGNNIEFEPGDQAIGVQKYQFNLTAESYIPQPISRYKAVQKIRTEVVSGTTDITEVINKLDIAVRELE